MSTPRLCSGVAVLDNKTYVTGGCTQAIGKTLSSVDCYDPVTNIWSQVAKMNIAREGHELVSLHWKLYAIGGYNGTFGESDVVHSAEVYDPSNNTWTLIQSEVEGRVGCGAGLIKKYYVV